MKLKYKKIAAFTLILLTFILIFLPQQTSGQKKLETEYPEILGFKPETVATLIPEYVRYIFNFFIVFIGLIALAVLIWAGTRYLTSSGKPEELRKARQQIRSAIFGIIILFLSYLILTTINPVLVVFRPLTLAPTPPVSPIRISISPLPTADLLGRIKQLAEATKEVANQITSTAQEIKSLTDGCDCGRTQPLCLVKQYRVGKCQAQFCYAASDDQPCPDIKKIRETQQKLVDLRDVILYYKNRSLVEVEDLKEDIEKFINVKLGWYEDKINAEKKVLEQCDTDQCKKEQSEIIEFLKKDEKKLAEEKNYKEELKVKLNKLAQVIAKIDAPTTELAALPDECQTNVEVRCQGSCEGGGHDTEGCFPKGCSGGNPCPTEEIQKQINKINSIVEQIKIIANEIIARIPAPPEEPPELCQNPQELAKINNVPYPRKNAPETERVLNCIKSKLPGQNLGDISTYDKKYDICNYTRGQRICGDCSHTLYSCHYGGETGREGAMAIDFGNEDIGDKIIKAAQECGVKSARCETKNGTFVSCADFYATHVHITVRGCDRN